jgi:hypothetical protein
MQFIPASELGISFENTEEGNTTSDNTQILSNSTNYSFIPAAKLGIEFETPKEPTVWEKFIEYIRPEETTLPDKKTIVQNVDNAITQGNQIGTPITKEDIISAQEISNALMTGNTNLTSEQAQQLIQERIQEAKDSGEFTLSNQLQNIAGAYKDIGVGIGKGVSQVGADIVDTVAEVLDLKTPEEREMVRMQVEQLLGAKNEPQGIGKAVGSILPYFAAPALLPKASTLTSSIITNLIGNTGLMSAQEGGKIIRGETSGKELAISAAVDLVAGVVPSIFKVAKSTADKQLAHTLSGKTKKGNLEDIIKIVEDGIKDENISPEVKTELNAIKERVLNPEELPGRYDHLIKREQTILDSETLPQEKKLSNNKGFANINFMKGLAGSAIGGTVGSTQGDTVKDKAVNATLGALVGFGISGAPKALKNTLIDDIMRKFTDPFHSLSRENADKFKDLVYGILKPGVAQGDIAARDSREAVVKILSEYPNQEKLLDDIVIRFMENPKFAEKLKEVDADLYSKLNVIRESIAEDSKWMFMAGKIKPSQYYSWGGRYLTRLYKQGDTVTGTQMFKGGKQYEVKSGRKFDSILDILSGEELEAIGYVKDPIKSIMATKAKVGQIRGLENFYREVIKLDGVVDPNVKHLLVELPEEFQVADLPTLMSPAYARKQIIPYLAELTHDGTIDKNKLKSFVKEVNEKYKALKSYENPNYYNIGDVEKTRYSVLSGLPIDKTVASYLDAIITLKEKPITIAEKLDAALGSTIALFKLSKVGLNFQAYPRNFISGAFQWIASGRSPISFVRETSQALKSMIKKDKNFKLAEKMGLFQSNYSSEEIRNIFNSLIENETITNNVLKNFLEKANALAKPYGYIDDLLKMARVNYELKKGTDIVQAIKIAQDAHFDYGMVSDLVKKSRSWGKANSSMLMKIIASPFLSYGYKTGGLLWEGIVNRPALTTALLSSVPTIKYAVDAYNYKENPRLAEYVERITPSYFDNVYTLRFIQKDKVIFVPVDYIIPWAKLNRLNVLAGIADLYGIGQSPVNLVPEIFANKKIFSGQKIYNEQLDSTMVKGLKSAGYVADTLFTPGTISNVIRAINSNHPLLPKLFGVNMYVYTLPQLTKMKQSEIEQLKSEVNKEKAKIIGSNKNEKYKIEAIQDLGRKAKNAEKRLMGE